jgi:hypothetical protein
MYRLLAVKGTLSEEKSAMKSEIFKLQTQLKHAEAAAAAAAAAVANPTDSVGSVGSGGFAHTAGGIDGLAESERIEALEVENAALRAKLASQLDDNIKVQAMADRVADAHALTEGFEAGACSNIPFRRKQAHLTRAGRD